MHFQPGCPAYTNTGFLQGLLEVSEEEGNKPSRRLVVFRALRSGGLSEEVSYSLPQ